MLRNMMTHPKVQHAFVASAFCSLMTMSPLVYADASKDGMRERLNKIFYWHLSDELKLTPDQEKKVVTVLQSIQSKRETALAMREGALLSLKKLPKSAPLKQTKPFLDQYMTATADLAGLDQEEYQELKNILGEALLAQFYIIRDDVTTRVRQALKK